MYFVKIESLEGPFEVLLLSSGFWNVCLCFNRFLFTFGLILLLLLCLQMTSAISRANRVHPRRFWVGPGFLMVWLLPGILSGISGKARFIPGQVPELPEMTTILPGRNPFRGTITDTLVRSTVEFTMLHLHHLEWVETFNLHFRFNNNLPRLRHTISGDSLSEKKVAKSSLCHKVADSTAHFLLKFVAKNNLEYAFSISCFSNLQHGKSMARRFFSSKSWFHIFLCLTMMNRKIEI